MGRLTSDAKARNRQNIVDAASRRFRTDGVDQVGIVDLMQDAGMTRGGFYNHFASKEDLTVAVFEESFAAVLAVLDTYLEPGDPRRPTGLAAFFDDYLGPGHRDSADGGCPSAALVVDAGRHGARAQHAYAEGAEGFLGRFAAVLAAEDADDLAPEVVRRRAIAMFSEMVGAMVLARAVRSSDPALSDELLDGARRNLRERTPARP